jgi:hypothetical protein
VADVAAATTDITATISITASGSGGSRLPAGAERPTALCGSVNIVGGSASTAATVSATTTASASVSSTDTTAATASAGISASATAACGRVVVTW